MSKFLNFGLGAGLTLWAGVAWLLGSALGLKGAQLYALRITLVVVGTIAALLAAWYYKRKQAGAAAEAGERVDANADVQMLLNEAEARLRQSKMVESKGIRELPTIVALGAPNSAKTTTVLRSGLDPELLSGQVYLDGNVTPTGTGNIWFSRNNILIEAGPKLVSDGDMWGKLINRLRSTKMNSIFGSGAAPRAVLVFYDAENLVKQGAGEAAEAAAKAIRLRLSELSAALGINVPVYVMFTKMDRIAFFLDYVRTVDERESAQVVGVTVPLVDRDSNAGAYGEEESRRLGDAFQQLVFALGERRAELLCRDSEETAAGTYEFPREFRKLRGPVVQFLIELCRPSQLQVGPFLRGFYFTGVRPVLVQEELAAQASAKESSLDANATHMFRYGQAAKAAPAARMVTKKVPQWIFLNQFFSQVLLADEAGMATSTSSTKANGLRRGLLAAGCCLALLFGMLTLISYAKNQTLVRDVNKAVKAVNTDPNAPKQVSLDSLKYLESLRVQLVRLREYERKGAPLFMRFGLFQGSALLPEARAQYFERFKTLLFGDTSNVLVNGMRSWPGAPGASDDYGDSYNTLKAYLITTSFPQNATQNFLPGFLQTKWQGTKGVDAERTKLIREQFSFYTSELLINNPYTSSNDAQTIDKARKYLAQFAGAARVYQTMLNEANAAVKPVIFNQRFPGSAEVVLNNREVAGAYTKPGFGIIQNALKNSSKYVNGEAWVLGSYGAGSIDTSKLQDEVRALYYGDFIRQWRDYFAKTVVVRYVNLADAAKKLNLTASPQSPLMELFWLGTQNTAVEAPEITKAFKPLHNLMPPANVDQYIGPSNTNYMTALTSLQNVLDQASKMPPEQSQAAADQSAKAANDAKLAARNTALTLGVDQDAHLEGTLQKLLEDPITYAEAVKPEGPSPAPLNGAGAAFCGQYKNLLAKFPFDPQSKKLATIEDVNAIFKPQSGALWVFYEQKLKAKLPKQGNVYTATADKPALTPRFVSYFNNIAKVASAFYANGASQDPKLNFTLKPTFTSDIVSVALNIDGQQVTMKPNAAPQQFSWPGTTPGVNLVLRAPSDQVFPSYDDLWAAFEFFFDADKPVPSPEWNLKGGRSDRAVRSPTTGQPYAVHFELDMLGAPPVFQKGFLKDIGCVAEVAK